MTFWFNGEVRSCRWCERRVSRPNFSRHVARCELKAMVATIAVFGWMPAAESSSESE